MADLGRAPVSALLAVHDGFGVAVDDQTYQAEPGYRGQSGITVGHEDLLVGGG